MNYLNQQCLFFGKNYKNIYKLKKEFLSISYCKNTIAKKERLTYNSNDVIVQLVSNFL